MDVSVTYLGWAEEKLTHTLGIPTIIDHDNDDFTLWESNAIIKYLVDRYDKENKIHFPSGVKESYLVDQWMIFQASGQVNSSYSLMGYPHR